MIYVRSAVFVPFVVSFIAGSAIGEFPPFAANPMFSTSPLDNGWNAWLCALINVSLPFSPGVVSAVTGAFPPMFIVTGSPFCGAGK